MFDNVLGRQPDGPGLAFWEGELNRGELMIGFSESAEFVRQMRSDVLVTMVFAGMLPRRADRAGFDFGEGGWMPAPRSSG